MKKDYPKIFEPITVRKTVFKNRVVMTPMGTNYADPDGGINDDHINYYRLRAKGGTGLIIVENVCVDFPTGSNGTSQLRLDHDMFMPKLYKLTEAVHNESFVFDSSVEARRRGSSSARER